MKNIVFIILLTTQIFFAKNGFENGNVLYQKGNYEEAIIAYKSVLNANKQSAELYFNLGNCYYKLNEVAPAIYNYEKALLLNPNDSEIQNNLKFAQKLQIDEIKEVQKVGFSKLIRDFTAAFHYNTWAWISVFFAFLFFVFFVGYYFSNTTLFKRVFFLGMCSVVFLIVISILSAIFEKNHFETEKPAIVFSEVVSVKSEPKPSSPEIVQLHEGTKVFVFTRFRELEKIQLTDETEGWIESSAIQEVK